jgi:hypothetical protein
LLVVGGVGDFFADDYAFVEEGAAEELADVGTFADGFGDDVAGSFESFFYGGYGLFSFGGLLLEAFQLVFVVLWVFLMIKAYQGELFKLPIAADIAENLAKK